MKLSLFSPHSPVTKIPGVGHHHQGSCNHTTASIDRTAPIDRAAPIDRGAVGGQAALTDPVAPGVTDMRGQNKVAFDTAQAALWSVEAAMRAASQGTFGVGGVLLGPHKELLAVSCNRVISEGKVADPTAHGERQLVDWYFDRQSRGENLPPAGDCTIVSSLDPCMMCAGSILTGGFKVISTTLDTRAGVNYTADGNYPTVPEGLQQRARENFAYFGVEGSRPYQGPAILGERQTLSAELEKQSLDVFLGSLSQVQQAIHHQTEGPVKDLSECQDAAVLSALRRHYPEALQVRFAPGKPDARLAQPLLKAARASQARGGAFQAAALLDPHGNLVMLRSGREELSPIRTAFMELTRAWAQVRAEAGPEGQKFLAPLKDCTLISLQGPAPDSTSIMELGAYGSSVEGPLPPHEHPAWQYVLPQQEQSQLDRQIENLPPLYSQVIRPQIQQVSDRALVHLCSHHEH